MADENVEKQSPTFSEIGRTGLKRSAGKVNEEFLRELRGDRGIEVYKEMRDNDPVIGGGIMAIKNLVRQADWDVEPGGDSPRDIEAAEFVRENMHDMERSWQEFIDEAMSMLVFGWSWFEIVYKRRRGNVLDPIRGSKFDDNRIGWQNFSIRSQESFFEWEFTDQGRVKALVQMPEPDFRRREIPRSKSLHFRTTSHKNNPEGRSVLRNAYRPWFFKKRIEEMEGIGVERDLAGLPKVTVPPNILDDNANQDEVMTRNGIEEMIQNLRNDEQAGIIMPAVFDADGNQLFDFELMATRGRKKFDTTEIIERYNSTTAMSMLADFIVIGHESVGSFALASSKTKLFSTAIASYMSSIAQELNKRAVPQLLRFNGMTDVNMPKITHSDIETLDLEQLSRYIKAVTGAGVDLTGDRALEFLADQVGLPAGALSGTDSQPEPSQPDEPTDEDEEEDEEEVEE